MINLIKVGLCSLVMITLLIPQAKCKNENIKEKIKSSFQKIEKTSKSLAALAISGKNSTPESRKLIMSLYRIKREINSSLDKIKTATTQKEKASIIEEVTSLQTDMMNILDETNQKAKTGTLKTDEITKIKNIINDIKNTMQNIRNEYFTRNTETLENLTIKAEEISKSAALLFRREINAKKLFKDAVDAQIKATYAVGNSLQSQNSSQIVERNNSIDLSKKANDILKKAINKDDDTLPNITKLYKQIEEDPTYPKAEEIINILNKALEKARENYNL